MTHENVIVTICLEVKSSCFKKRSEHIYIYMHMYIYIHMCVYYNYTIPIGNFPWLCSEITQLFPWLPDDLGQRSGCPRLPWLRLYHAICHIGTIGNPMEFPTFGLSKCIQSNQPILTYFWPWHSMAHIDLCKNYADEYLKNHQWMGKKICVKLYHLVI